MEIWEIVYAPDKPSMAPDQHPTVNVIASYIDPKVANTLAFEQDSTAGKSTACKAGAEEIFRRSLVPRQEAVASESRILSTSPQYDLKRIKNKQSSESVNGRTQLSVILCLASEHDNPLDSIPPDVEELVNTHQLSPFITKVSKYAALSKEEWEEECELWPTSYHPPTYNIDGITGFGEEDSQSVCGFMKYAIQLAKSGDNVVNLAVIVDPSVQQVIATACDQTSYWSTHENNTAPNTDCFGKLEDSVSQSESALPSSRLPDNSKQLYTSVSCLYPWRWVEQQVDSRSCSWHPLWHAAIVAVESSAARDIHLFPSYGKIQAEYAERDQTVSFCRLSSQNTEDPL